MFSIGIVAWLRSGLATTPHDKQQNHIGRPAKTFVQSPADDLRHIDFGAVDLIVRQWQIKFDRFQFVNLIDLRLDHAVECRCRRCSTTD